MLNTNTQKQFIIGALIILASQFITVNASATAQIFGSAVGKGIAVSGCQGCHSGTAGSESKGNLKPNYQTAFNLDKTGLTSLKKLINGCAAGQILNPTTFVCAAGAVKPVVCALPQIRDAAKEKCVAAKTITSIIGNAKTGVAQTIVYTVNCPTGTDSLKAAVLDLKPVNKSLISLQIFKTVPTVLSIDKVDADPKYSQLLINKGKAGKYTVNINKSKSTQVGAENFTALFSCRSIKDSPLVTLPVFKLKK
jgi:hypothetical protein